MKKLTEAKSRELIHRAAAKLPRPAGDRELMENVFELLEVVFKHGKGRRGTNSKTYTGPALEAFSAYCVKAAATHVGLHDISIDDDYIEDADNRFDRLRLDLNVTWNDKSILMQESRVWIDKPFLTLKYQVIEDIVYLPHGRARLDDNIIFPIVTICCDITETTRATREHFFAMVLRSSELSQKTDYGMNRINLFTLSAGRRADGYFDAGINETSVSEYVNMLVTHFDHYKRRRA